MKISLITDEISSDPETAFELAAEWGVQDLELRGYFVDRVPRLSAFQKRRIRDLISEYGSRIVAVSPGLFKLPYPSPLPPRAAMAWMEQAEFGAWEESQKQLRFHCDELLPASLDYACELGARLVVIFSFSRGGLPPGPPPDEVLDCFERAAGRAQAAGLTLVIETEEGFWADTGARSADLVRLVDHPALRINWDPGNAFCAGDCPFPDGYLAVREWVRHVHFKDAGYDWAGKTEYRLQGEIDWEGQIRALAADGYSGHISVETHLRPRVASARSSLERLRSLIAAAAS